MSTPGRTPAHPHQTQWTQTYEITNQAKPIDLALDTVEGEIQLADDTPSTPDPAGSEGETIMSEDTREETITFIIDIPSGSIEELKQLLEGLEVKFDPENQVVAFNDTLMCHSMAMGYDLPGMVVGMNRYLDEAKLTPRIPEDHEKWSTERRQAFLQLAIENFDWDNSTVNYAWWEDERIIWLELTQDHPLVFEEQE